MATSFSASRFEDGPLPFRAPRPLAEMESELFKWESLSTATGLGIEPFSLQWFLSVEWQRHCKQAPWIPQLLEFGRHTDETILCIGDSLGTDWTSYARNGASVIACSPFPSELGLIRRNFEVRGLSAKFMHAMPTKIPLPNSAVDVVCLSGMLQELADQRLVVEELYRVLKPGGKVLAVLPARYPVEFWRALLPPWRKSSRRVPLPNHSPWLPAREPEQGLKARGYRRRTLKKLFHLFQDHRIHKRHLRRSEIPLLWRWYPRRWMEKLVGRYFVLKAFKPVTLALPQAAAA